MRVKRKILVIDDDLVIRELLKRLLEKAGYEVILADNGLIGVETAQRERPDLVITDGLLPKMHGFLVCRAIKQFEPIPPKVIVLTGLYTKPTYKWEVKGDYKADDLMEKPIEPADLIACVKKHLADLTPLDCGYGLPSDLPTGETGLDHPQGEDAFPPADAKFSDAEMEEIFSDWSIPAK